MRRSKTFEGNVSKGTTLEVMRVARVQARIGRLKQKSRGASQHYQITQTADESGKTVASMSWTKELAAGTMASHPGVYCLRTNVLDWDEARLWQAYATLTNIESVFRSLKSELGCFTTKKTAPMGICSSRCCPISACR